MARVSLLPLRASLDDLLKHIGTITYGGERINYADVFERYAQRLGSHRYAHWRSNIHVGFNHGHSDRDYLVGILDAMLDEYVDQCRAKGIMLCDQCYEPGHEVADPLAGGPPQIWCDRCLRAAAMAAYGNAPGA